jgi:hypothetical protein
MLEKRLVNSAHNSSNGAVRVRENIGVRVAMNLLYAAFSVRQDLSRSTMTQMLAS